MSIPCKLFESSLETLSNLDTIWSDTLLFEVLSYRSCRSVDGTGTRSGTLPHFVPRGPELFIQIHGLGRILRGLNALKSKVTPYS